MNKTALLVLAGIAVTLLGVFLFKQSKPANSETVNGENKSVSVSPTQDIVSCMVCGPQGIHNVDGFACPEGYECKRGMTTSASYCVKTGEDVKNCEPDPIETPE